MFFPGEIRLGDRNSSTKHLKFYSSEEHKKNRSDFSWPCIDIYAPKSSTNKVSSSQFLRPGVKFEIIVIFRLIFKERTIGFGEGRA